MRERPARSWAPLAKTPSGRARTVLEYGQAPPARGCRHRAWRRMASPSPGCPGEQLVVAASAGDVLVWIVGPRPRSRVGGRGGELRRPFLLRARTHRQPRVACGPVPPAVGGVRCRSAGADLRRRHRRDVPVRDRVRRRSRRRALGGVAVRPDVGGDRGGGAILAEVIVVIGIQAGGGDFATEDDISAAFGAAGGDR